MSANHPIAPFDLMPHGTPADLDPEVWKVVLGWPAYEVSNRGAVRSLWGMRRQYGGKMKVIKGVGKRLSYGRHRFGYPQVNLFDGAGNHRVVAVHALVLETFIGPRPPGMHACHNDGNPSNNRLDNLRWDTQTANRIDSVIHGNHPTARLRPEDISIIWGRLAAGESVTKIAKDHGVSRTSIHRIRNGLGWTHITKDLPPLPACHA